MFYAVFELEPRRAPGCSGRLNIGQKCTARRAEECDEQLEIRLAR
jgi:hypothetical protein